MDQFEYVMVLVSIIVGLGITHVLLGIGGIIDRRSRKDDSLELSLAHAVWLGYCFLWLVMYWWWEYELSTTVANWTMGLYLFLLFYAVNYSNSIQGIAFTCCNQCHIVKAHKSLTLNGTTCTSCHDLSVMTFSRSSMPATFPHEMHSGMFSCGECHSDLFRMKKGANPVDMRSIYGGKYCGKCHNGTIASPAEKCKVCHKFG